MKPKVFIEVLSRLGTCYIFLKTERKVKRVSLKASTISLFYAPDEMEEVLKVDGIILKPDTISSLEFYDQIISFRVQLEDNELCKFSDFQFESPQVTEIEFRPSFYENSLVSISCRCCDYTILDSIKLERVLPLPSGALDNGDFFCHDCPDSLTKTSLKPDATECFYGHFFVLLQAEVGGSSTIFYCKRCLSWLGTINDKILKLWDCSTLLSSEDRVCEQLEIAYSHFRQIIKHACLTSFYGPMKIVVECPVEENETNYLLLWIVDDNLVCLVDSNHETSSDSDVSLVRKCVSKVLYLFQEEKTATVESWIKNINVTIIDVAKQMLLSALDNLNAVNKKLPPQSRKTNNMYLSYLDPIL